MNTPGTEQKQKRNLRYYSLDFWRGVACLTVVIFHSTIYITDNPAHVSQSAVTKQLFHFLSFGWAGVPIFFVISGYCITAACEAMGNRGTSGKFFTRRFKRIFPPYWIVLLALIALHGVTELVGYRDLLRDNVVPMASPSSLSISHWVGNATLTEVWRDHFFGAKSRLLLGPAWSLCYEEQFYLICGLALFLGRKWFYRVLIALSIVVAGIVVVNYSVAQLPIGGFFFDGRWLMFAAGVLVFYTVQEMKREDHKKSLVLLGVSFLLSAVWVKTAHDSLARELTIGFAFSSLLILLHRFDLRIVNARILKPVTMCGMMCYSLYLVHLPIVKGVTGIFYRAGITGEWATLALTIPVALLCSVCLAWGFHLAVERKFMNTLPMKAPELKEPLAKKIESPIVDALPSAAEPKA